MADTATSYGLGAFLQGLVGPIQRAKEINDQRNFLLGEREIARQEGYQERQDFLKEQNQNVLARELLIHGLNQQYQQQQRQDAQNLWQNQIQPLVLGLPRGRQLHPLTRQQRDAVLAGLSKAGELGASNQYVGARLNPYIQAWNQALEPSADELYAQQVASGKASPHDQNGNIDPRFIANAENVGKNIDWDVANLDNSNPWNDKTGQPIMVNGKAQTIADQASANLQADKNQLRTQIEPYIKPSTWDWYKEQVNGGATVGEIYGRLDDAQENGLISSTKGDNQYWLMKQYLNSIAKPYNVSDPEMKLSDLGKQEKQSKKSGAKKKSQTVSPDSIHTSSGSSYTVERIE